MSSKWIFDEGYNLFDYVYFSYFLALVFKLIHYYTFNNLPYFESITSCYFS